MRRPSGSGGDKKKLVAVLEREVEEPRSHDQFLDDLTEALPDQGTLLRLLKAKDKHHRHAFYVKSELIWYRRFSWKIMRPLFVVAVLAAVGFSFQKTVDPTMGFASFVLGAVSVYLAIQYFAHRWMRQNEDLLNKVQTGYQDEVRALLDDLRSEK